MNQRALQVNGPARITWTGVLGTVLILLGTLGWFGGCGAILDDGLRHGQDGRSVGHAYVHTLCCVFLFASGLMLLRAGSDRVRRPFLLAAAGLGMLAALALLVTSGLIVVFVTCFTGR